MSSRDISFILKEYYGESKSYSTISNMAHEFNQLKLDWEQSNLNSYYKAIYCDCQYQTVRRGDSYSKEAIHLIYGIREDNYRELLHLSLNPTESK